MRPGTRSSALTSSSTARYLPRLATPATRAQGELRSEIAFEPVVSNLIRPNMSDASSWM
jgi:hypothetical protein